MTKVQTLISKLTILAMIASLFAVVTPAHAAGLTDMSDTMTNQTISETSNHTILFTTPTGVAASAIVVVDFAAGFTSPAGLDFEDLDFSFDATPDGVCDTGDTEITLAAAPAGATMGAVRTDPDTLTFTNGSTVVAAGSEICIEIGKNAETGAVGVEQFTNPGTLGSYSVSFSGSFGDTGTLAVPIQDSDQVSITATVDPTITFDLDTATTDTESAASYSVALGTITTTNSKVSGATDSVNFIWADLDTNASGGAVVTVQNANGANGLVSTSVSGDTINSANGTIANGSENYGICVTATSATTGSFNEASPFDNADCTANEQTPSVGGLTGAIQNLVNTNNLPVSGGRIQVTVAAAISGTTAAHADYTDTLTFIATGTF